MSGALKVELVARYPVKALRGESIEVIELDERGVVGDRRWALRAENGKFGSGKSTRRFTYLPRLLEMSSRVLWGIHTVVELPDGREYATVDPKVHGAVSEVVGAPVTVAEEAEISHLDDSPVHLLTGASLRWMADQVGDAEVDWRRFRPNILVDCAGDNRVEDDWIGRRLEIGTAEVEITGLAVRCAVIGHALDREPDRPDLLAALTDHDLTIGAYAKVIRPGVVGTGDPLRFR
ncbi:hypothetical protein SAMN05192558_103324 [Actinokineospora alba]|uniref:MOSC domain-containing protein n=1 Tax=Actinokineospora alba TaxID=504798 RepID=A0A1H0K3D9_9PSEU|nr:MOSC domain-containing protein [Actinokineospora alba]TDP68060.1 hypothetical protein C8E96_3618 [Actinokineospora alba]SDH91658.1 hypothetical protein SAMN05421871_102725 [Actinokineospora alba]SDO50535.1 hypothetical protein SAMN05192558_103324 [Actinokineospora alba]